MKTEQHRKLLAVLSSDDFCKISQKVIEHAKYIKKYMDTRKYVAIAQKYIDRLRLHKRTGLKILDISTGTGYFPFLCREYGHTIMATTQPLDSVSEFWKNEFIYQRLVQEYLNIPVIELYIRPFCEITEISGKYDMVTSFSSCFHLLPSGRGGGG